MKSKVIPKGDLKEFYTAEQCYIAEIYNEPADRSHSLARCRVKPGVTTSRHLLKETSEIYFILEGNGLVELADEPAQEVEVGDSVCIPPNTAQRITNTGQKDLVFLCVCRPAFMPECYTDV